MALALVFPRRHGRACPGHPRLSVAETKTWMPGTRPGMTSLWSYRAHMRLPCATASICEISE
ncbi:hypothetical protein DXU07_03475 [Bradyrhizobium elkanii]|nr:hypothetical protein [Bradyrhizobium elkanii]NWL68804.1 hypothetical protein [Bradyrhizobium elkanii]QOZ16473.1 hypothetical protein XI02_16820 [Bradyrhizobium sp. CCBAU 21365]RYM24609.1 hypothetical protein EWH13_21275 [Bradyrhizobium elkanii]